MATRPTYFDPWGEERERRKNNQPTIPVSPPPLADAEEDIVAEDSGEINSDTNDA